MVEVDVGVIGHEGSTIIVVLNGLRLLRTPKRSLPRTSTDPLPQSRPLVLDPTTCLPPPFLRTGSSLRPLVRSICSS